jgi:hypothetical protein
MSVLVHSQSDQMALHQITRYSTIQKVLVRDSLTILPASVKIISTSKDTIASSDFSVNNNTITLTDKALGVYRSDTLLITYRTLGVNLGRAFYRLDSNALLKSDDVIKTGYEFQLGKKEKNIFENDALNYNGSFSRGFSIGNRQSLVLNSNFNLQMTGMISQDIEIAAALTDANIPIQAEGNTHQLNEFDRVYIEIKKDKNILTAGDLDIRNPENYFSRYQKKIKGLRYTGAFKPGMQNDLTIDAGYAISRGKFARNTLDAQEGNQGPYKLKGNNGELFFVILSGTEKVYYDGIPLKRGSEYDYVIDYNLAEISFTFNRLITKDSRIIVEFEYVDQSYLRSLQTISLDWKKGRNQTYFNLFNEMDNKTATGNIALDSTDIEILENSGDDIAGASRNGIRRYTDATGIKDVVLYRKIYDPESNDSILVYAPNKDEGKYIAYFSDVGDQKGSYGIKEATTINGRVYEFVGIGKGRYEPIIRLVSPRQQQLIVLGNRYQLNGDSHVHTEISLSNIDQNRFSSLDDGDNLGAAAMINFKTSKTLTAQEDSSRNNSLNTAIIYEFKNRNFLPVNPYRPTEFIRDWNLLGNTTEHNEHIINSEAGIQWNNAMISYGFSGFFQEGNYRGYKHLPKLVYGKKGNSIEINGNFLFTNSSEFNSRFFRPSLEIQRTLKRLSNLKLGFKFNQEYNKIHKKDSLTLEKYSFYFNNLKWWLQTGNHKNTPLQFYINYRQDYLPDGVNFIQNLNAFDAGLKGKWLAGAGSDLNYNFTFRQLSVDTLFTGQSIRPNSTLLGKLTHFLKLRNDFIIASTQLDVNSGQEAKGEFVFIELTNPGEGTYIWIDSNEDGVQQKGEFEAAPFSDVANFIKIIQYNNEFIRVNNTAFNHTFRITPKKIFADKTLGATGRFFSKISIVGVLKLQEKSMDSGSPGLNLPFLNNKQDTSIIVLKNSSNLTLYYNKLDPVFELQFNHAANRSKNLQLDGLIQYGSRLNSFKFRVSKGQFDLILTGKQGLKSYQAALYPIKDYAFDLIAIESELKYRLSQKIGLQLMHVYLNRTNDSSLGEALWGNRFVGKFNLRNFRGMNVQVSVNYARYNYTGESGTSLELAMLEGLKNGNNFLWKTIVTRKMSKNIDLSIRYEGRRTGTSKTVHVASMQAKARF